MSGRRPPFSRWPGRGLLPSPRAALSNTPWRSPSLRRWKLGVPRVEPGIPGLRVQCIPRSAACPGLQGADPSPTAQTGCDRPRVAPCPLRSFPQAPGAGGPGTRRSRPREGTWADPLPPPHGGVRRRAAAPSPASRFLERSAEITPSPLGADLGTWAGPRPLPTPRRPSKNLVPQTKFGDPNPALGQPLLTSRVERTQATPPVRSWRGEGEGTLRSPPGHSLLKRAPLWFAGSR